MDVSVGTEGFEIVSLRAFDIAGVDVSLLTVMVAVPALASRLAGTCARSAWLSFPMLLVVNGVPFHSTVPVATSGYPAIGCVKLVPTTNRVESSDPAVICDGDTDDITGVDCGRSTRRSPAVVMPPPGAGFDTVIASTCAAV